jgi:hypothetical protein
MSGWFQVRVVEGAGGSLRVPIAARSRSLAGAYAKLASLRGDGIEDRRLGVFEPRERRDGNAGRWWRMPTVLA